MNDPRMSGGPVSLDNWSKPGAGSENEMAPPEEGKGALKCPVCGAEFELKEPEAEAPAEMPEEGMVA